MRVKLRRNTKIFFFFFFLIIQLGIGGITIGAITGNGKIIAASCAFFIGFFLLLFIGTHIVGGNIGLVRQLTELPNKSCIFRTKVLKKCCFYKEVVQKLKFPNNSIVLKKGQLLKKNFSSIL